MALLLSMKIAGINMVESINYESGIHPLGT